MTRPTNPPSARAVARLISRPVLAAIVGGAVWLSGAWPWPFRSAETGTAGQLDELAARTRALRKKVATDPDVPEKSRKALDAELSELEMKVADARKASGDAERLAARVAALERAVRLSAERVQERYDRIEEALLGPPRAGPAPADVLVVALHSSNLGVTRYRDAVAALFRPAALGARGPGTRVGFLLAIGGEAQKSPAVGFADPKPDVSGLDRLGPKPNGVAEQLGQLAPAVAARFDAKSGAARRVVVLASARCAPPDEAEAWKGVAVDALLVADDTRPDADRVLDWHKFVTGRGGSVTVLLAEPGGQPDALVPRVEEHLRRLTRTPPGEK